MITKAKQTKVLISLFFRFRRHHFGHECQRQSPSTLVRHDQESRPSPCQDPLLECQLHRLIDTTNCYYIYFFSLHATLPQWSQKFVKRATVCCIDVFSSCNSVPQWGQSLYKVVFFIHEGPFIFCVSMFRGFFEPPTYYLRNHTSSK